jgi:hypothetical protein
MIYHTQDNHSKNHKTDTELVDKNGMQEKAFQTTLYDGRWSLKI